MKKLNKILWGIVLVVVGLVLSLKALGIINFSLFFDGWWTLIIIIPCAIAVFTSKDKTASIIGLVVGILLLLACQNIVSFDMLWALAIPATITIIGVRLIFGGFGGKKSKEVKKALKNKGENFKSHAATFAESSIKLEEGESFEGAELNAIFGKLTLDLSKAEIGASCAIDASAIFGGIAVILPEGVGVVVNSSSMFGGVSTPKSKKDSNGEVIVYINGNCMFGGVDIK